MPLKGPGYHLLGDHFHPLIATLAPTYRVFPTPLTLVVAQALLMAPAVVPLTRRAEVTLVCREPVRPGPERVVVYLRDPSVQAPCAVADTARMLTVYQGHGYRRLVDRDGLLLLRRP